MEILGHRGALAEHAPENTRAAVEAALRSGAHGVEVDVRLTADGVAVCAHDPDLVREAGLASQVRELTYAELGAVRVRGHRIPALAGVLGQVGGRGRVVLDLKPDPEPERVAAAVAAALGAAPRADVVLSSFCPLVLAAVAAALPGLPRAALLPDGALLSQRLAVSVHRGDAALHLPVRVVLAAPDIVASAHRNGLQVRVWTVNRLLDARLLELLGVDAVISDVPAELRRGLARSTLIGDPGRPAVLAGD